jgi:uncharacterized protein (TIGR01777 family)
MEIVIAGASGFIGRHLTAYLEKEGNHVSVIKRNDLASDKLAYLLRGKDVIINLMGESIAGRWTKSKKKRIMESRIRSTRLITDALMAVEEKGEEKESVFIQASAVGIYDERHRHTEESQHFGRNFLSDVVRAWEKEAARLEPKINKIVILRMGVVLGNNSRIMKRMLLSYKMRIGIQPGKGNQSFSFIHIKDLVKIFGYVIEKREIKGVINAVSPERITFKGFNESLSNLLKPLWKITIPDFILKLIFGEGASVFSEGQHVVPELLLKAGFVFKYADMESAIKEILQNR